MTTTPTQGDRELFAKLIGLDVTDEPKRILAGAFDDVAKMQMLALHAQAARIEGAREMKRATLRACADQSYMDPPRNTALACCNRIREIDPVKIADLDPHTITGEAG